MSGLPKFAARFGAANHCIECPSRPRRPGGYVRKVCGCREAQRLKTHVRIYGRQRCAHQEPVIAGTIFRRTPPSEWRRCL